MEYLGEPPSPVLGSPVPLPKARFWDLRLLLMPHVVAALHPTRSRWALLSDASPQTQVAGSLPLLVCEGGPVGLFPGDHCCHHAHWGAVLCCNPITAFASWSTLVGPRSRLSIVNLTRGALDTAKLNE